MTLWDKVYSLCTENHGIVTAAGAATLGVKSKDLVRWKKSGRLIQQGRGVYRVTHYPMSGEDSYAIAVAEAGPKAYLCGESVLALLNLAPTNPRYIDIAVPARLRRRLNPSYRIHVKSANYLPMHHAGIPMQKPVDAIRDGIGHLMSERLEAAAQEAYRTGKLFKEDLETLLNEIHHHDQTSA